MNYEIPLLQTGDIEVKIKQCTKAGAVALLYKTARVDYRILDQVFGPLGWQVDYNEIKGNLYCTISLWDKENKQWVRKTNCGIESREDSEGNEKKGEASDAAKRAGFVVGIGAELYTAPFIFMEVNTEEGKDGKYKLKDPYAKYVVTQIGHDKETRTITSLAISNEKTGVVVYKWAMAKSGSVKLEKAGKTPTAKKENSTNEILEDIKPTPVEVKPEPKVEVKTEAPKAPKKEKEAVKTVETAPAKELAAPEAKMPLKGLVTRIGQIAKKMLDAGDLPVYAEVVKEITGDSSFKCTKATEEQYDIVLAIYKALVAKGFDK